MALRVKASKAAIKSLREEHPGRFSAEFGIDLSSVRDIWEKANPLPSDLVVVAAKERGLVPKTVKDRTKVLQLLMGAWKETGMKKKDFSDFEAALVRAGMELRRKKRCGSGK